MIKKNLGKYLKTLKKVVDSKEEYYIWNVTSLLKEMNSILGSRDSINVHQFGCVLQYQKQYKVFKDNTKKGLYYIFIKRK